MDQSANVDLPIRSWCVPNTPQWAYCAGKATTDWKAFYTLT